MKKIALTAALMLASSLALAAPPATTDTTAARETAPVPQSITQAQFETQKQKIVQALDKQLKVIKESRGCVIAAQQPDQVRDCMSKLRIAPPRGEARGPQAMEHGPRHGKHGTGESDAGASQRP